MWAKDSESKQCTGCTRKFTQFLRRHHCRGCGKVFCDACTRQKELLVKGDKKLRKERVCTQCSTNHAIDREEILFKLLGPELGSKYYYLFKRAGYGELQSLTELKPDQLNAVFTTVGIADKHKLVIAKKLQDCKLTLLGGSAPIAMGMMGDGMLSTSVTVGSYDFSKMHRSPEQRHSSILENSMADFAGAMDAAEEPIETLGRESPKPGNGKEKVDMKYMKKRWQEEMKQMENERQRRQAQLHVLDASMGAQTQMLARLKQACTDEEAKIGRLQALEEELHSLRGRHKVMENEEAWREEEIGTAVEDMARETKERKDMFRKGEHKVDACQLCTTPYKLLNREHHCRHCYRSVCDKCSRSRNGNLRCCDWCMAEHVMQSTTWDREVKVSRAFRLAQLKHLKKACENIISSEPDIMGTGSVSPTPPLRPRVLSNGTLDKSTMQSDSVLDRV
eukprot:TRINITY_DN8374_c1_g1_i2.p1 TRINITY_DN8374_c1_g1~~TRINITY_DN8374_c1_g1_i2.p1  ORF type:complete len:503 (+),score=218.14 TRINITY_DN8374_c1_g1_i2:165-1511(+)